MTGALPLLRWGRPDLLSAVASGELILTGALREPSDPQPDPPATAITDGTITGTKIGVLYAQQSQLILVPADRRRRPRRSSRGRGHADRYAQFERPA